MFISFKWKYCVFSSTTIRIWLMSNTKAFLSFSFLYMWWGNLSDSCEDKLNDLRWHIISVECMAAASDSSFKFSLKITKRKEKVMFWLYVINLKGWFWEGNSFRFFHNISMPSHTLSHTFQYFLFRMINFTFISCSTNTLT